MYFFFATSPETLAARRPAFEAASVNFTCQGCITNAAQITAASARKGANLVMRSMSLALRWHQDVLRLPGERFLFAQTSQLRKFLTGDFGFARAALPRIDLGHFVV